MRLPQGKTALVELLLFSSNGRKQRVFLVHVAVAPAARHGGTSDDAGSPPNNLFLFALSRRWVGPPSLLMRASPSQGAPG
ncbi:hypothetical protein CEXT_662321 [Caerostris extrusa]|uniref:Uncharacterized protein n=1 Tax=Caerostris extrusa TaxID=172846 RepID=A0AAV4ND78_CAEEX|nr:hypothetical protein CEXT_662321 [Caerostris extrusa]